MDLANALCATRTFFHLHFKQLSPPKRNFMFPGLFLSLFYIPGTNGLCVIAAAKTKILFRAKKEGEKEPLSYYSRDGYGIFLQFLFSVTHSFKGEK